MRRDTPAIPSSSPSQSDGLKGWFEVGTMKSMNGTVSGDPHRARDKDGDSYRVCGGDWAGSYLYSVADE